MYAMWNGNKMKSGYFCGLYGPFYGRELSETDVRAINLLVGEQVGNIPVMKKIALERIWKESDSEESPFVPCPFYWGW